MDYILLLGRPLGKSALAGTAVFMLKVNLLETVHHHLCFQSWHESDTWAAAVVPDIVHVHLDSLDAGMFFYLMYTGMAGIVGCMVRLASANEIIIDINSTYMSLYHIIKISHLNPVITFRCLLSPGSFAFFFLSFLNIPCTLNRNASLFLLLVLNTMSDEYSVIVEFRLHRVVPVFPSRITVYKRISIFHKFSIQVVSKLVS